MAVRFSDLLDPTRIELNVRSGRRTAALSQVAGQLETHPAMRNYRGFYQELLARERVDSTCLGNEVALPHARTDNVETTIAAVGRHDSGVYFERAGQNVRLMFVLATPKHSASDYLQVVSALCRLLKSPRNREALLTAATPDAFVAAVRAAEEAAGA